MKMTPPSEFTADAKPLDSIAIEPSKIQNILLQRVLSMGVTGQIPLLVAAALMGFAVIGIGTETLMWALIATQTVIQFVIAAINSTLRRKMEAKQPDRLLFAAYVTAEGLSGAVWGLMMLPVAAVLGQGLGPLFVCLTLIVIITISAMMPASVRILSIAVVAGFFATLFPQTIYFYDILGPLPFVATLLLPPSLLWVTDLQAKQAKAALVNELEKEQLAVNLEEALKQSDYLAKHDSLTGLLNRRAFQWKLEEVRKQQPEAEISIILIDLDHFKAVNDNFGHDIGDAVLTSTAALINNITRPNDFSARCDEAAARWGGEEFIIALVGCPIDAAAAVSERLRARIAGHIDPQWPEGLSVSGSFGVAIWDSQDALATGIAKADKAMYQAKVSGRNRVELAA
ncbi:MAG: GGDEF domain-containing protein [Parasphingorhabdus sp.]|uniref:GGDEF domain-containing protein n=2 Tax=Parasphingorhabdus sp. TaxID=2709688 RepID=UPI0032656DFE